MTCPRGIRRGFSGRAHVVARSLLGDVLVVQRGRTRCSGRIVETEAYLGPHDAACHTAGGRTARNSTMWLGGGHLYVYRIYGVHLCLNIVTGRRDEGAAVLIRAIEPLEGVEAMRRRRRMVSERDLCRGPGRLCAAMGVQVRDDGLDLRSHRRIWIERGQCPSSVTLGPRVGMGQAAGAHWGMASLRFCDAHSGHLSRPGPRALGGADAPGTSPQHAGSDAK